MARTFADTTSDYLSASSYSSVTGVPLTMAAWVKLTAVGAVARVICTIRQAAANSSQHEFILQMNSSEQIQAITADAGAPVASVTTGTVSAGTWAHTAAVFSTTTNRVAYINGTAATANTNTRAPTGIDLAAIGVLPFSSGSFATPWYGEIAEVGIWSVALDAAEIGGLAKGMSPLMIRPTSLVNYWQIMGRNSPEPDALGLNTMTVNGTAVADHCRVLMPARKRILHVAAAAGGSLVGDGLTRSALLNRRRLAA